MVSTVIPAYAPEDLLVPTAKHNFLNATKNLAKMVERVKMSPLMVDTTVAIVLMGGQEVIVNR